MPAAPCLSCLPSTAKAVSGRHLWLHEVKIRWLSPDTRARAQAREAVHNERRRLNWPLPLDRRMRTKECRKDLVIDGEAVILGVDGVPDCNQVPSRRHDEGLSSMPSTASRWSVRPCASCRARCVRPLLAIRLCRGHAELFDAQRQRAGASLSCGCSRPIR